MPIDSRSFGKNIYNMWFEHCTFRKDIKYRPGGNGQRMRTGDYWCDNRGMILWNLRQLGVTLNSPGTNYMMRYQMRTIYRINVLTKLQVGNLVFKTRKPGQFGYSLPPSYRYGNEGYSKRVRDLDCYHVGIVYSVRPLMIYHYTPNGLVFDKKICDWKYAGFLKCVTGGSDHGAFHSPPPPKVIKEDPRDTVWVVPTGKRVMTVADAPMYRAPDMKFTTPIIIPKGTELEILKGPPGATFAWTYVYYDEFVGYIQLRKTKKITS